MAVTHSPNGRDLRAVLGIAAPPATPSGQRLPNQIDPSRLTPRRLPHPRVMSVYSSKGGVGKTTLAMNFAARVSHRAGLRVLLIDLDVGFPDVGARIHKYTPTVVEAINDPALCADSLERWLHVEPSSGFWALLGPMRPDLAADRDLLSPAAFRRVLRAAAGFDAVILDCPVEIDDPLVREFAFDVSESICFVVNNERATLVDARRALDRMTNSQGDYAAPGLGIAAGKIGVVVNQLLDGVGYRLHEVEAVLGGHQIVGVLPDDRVLHVGAANAARVASMGARDLPERLDRALGSLMPWAAPTTPPTHDARLALLQHDLERPRWAFAARIGRRLRGPS